MLALKKKIAKGASASVHADNEGLFILTTLVNVQPIPSVVVYR